MLAFGRTLIYVVEIEIAIEILVSNATFTFTTCRYVAPQFALE